MIRWSQLAFVALLPVFASCRSNGLATPWAFNHVSRPMQLPKGVTHVRGSFAATEGDGASSGAQAALEYGVDDKLSLGLSVGAAARGSTREGAGRGDEVAAVKAIYGFMGDERRGGAAAQLEMLFEDGESVDLRSSVGALNVLDDASSVMGRAGFSLRDEDPAKAFFEAAYWRRVGQFHATLESAFTFGSGNEQWYVVPGIVTQFRDIVQFQLGAPLGLTRESADWQLVASLLFRF